MFTLSYISCNVIPFRLPFTIDIAFLGTAFFLLGHLCGKGIKYIFEKKSLSFDFILLIISGALFVLCNRYTNPVCYMYINKYDDFPFMVVCAILGTVMSFVLAKFATRIFDKISFLRNIVMWYSVNSLAVFPVHLTIKVLSIPVLSHLGLNNWFCLLILMFGLTIPIVNIITKYFPFLLGEFNFSKFFRKNKVNIVH